MSIRAIESISSGIGFYSLRDKAYHHVQRRAMEAFDKIDAVRQNVDTKEKLDLYVKNARAVFKDTMGSLPYDNSLPMNGNVTKVIEEPGLTIKNVIFQSREQVYITGNLYIPSVRSEKCPAVLLQCGHTHNGKGAAC